jgi:hypothetical protein
VEPLIFSCGGEMLAFEILRVRVGSRGCSREEGHLKGKRELAKRKGKKWSRGGCRNDVREFPKYNKMT